MIDCIRRGTWTGKDKRSVGATSAGIHRRREIDQFRIRYHLQMGTYPTVQVIAESLGMTLSSVSRYLNNPAVEATGIREFSLEEMLDSNQGFESLIAEVELTDMIILAYHRGQIVQALDSLPAAQKRYVVLRFWCGFVTSELKTVFGYDPSALWTSKKNGARDKLRAELAPLALMS
jgi:DNA-directed RNA polymerase specialized sigma24 family protein